METQDSFNLRWDGFDANIKAAFSVVRDESEFSNVTLVAGNGKQAKANKVILAGGSSFFFNVLRQNPHPHPLIYLKGVAHNQLLSLLDFLYTGEASIVEKDLNDFLNIAEDLKVKGLTPTGSQMKSNPYISAPLQSQEPALQVEAATNELVPSPKASRPTNMAGSDRDNAFPQATCDENHVGSNNVKVEVGDAEHYNFAYRFNEHGQQLISRVSLKGCNVEVLDESGSKFENNQRNEDLYEQSEECQNYHVFPTEKKPKQETIDSSNDIILELVDNEPLNYDWYTGEENNRMVQAEQEEDDYFEVDNSLANFEGKQEILDSNCDMNAEEALDNEHSTHICDERKKFSRPNYSKTRKKIHTDSYQCEVCFKRFSRRDHFKKHERTHTGEKPFQCSICFKRFSQIGGLKHHEVIHTGEKPYRCEVCFKTFSRLRTLQDHDGIHTGENPYSCLQCPKKFSRPSHLKVHERVHTGEKPYQCVICFKRFSSLQSLNKHKVTHKTGEA